MLFSIKRNPLKVAKFLGFLAVVSIITIFWGLGAIQRHNQARLYRKQDEALRRRSAAAGISKIIVGHYIGPGYLYDNASDVLNENHFDPIPGEGEQGRPVAIAVKDVIKMQHVFQANRFNLMASDRISLNRSIPDVRRPMCLKRAVIYEKSTLPDTSVIIVFHNEAWSVLLRTVWSVINRSPRHLVREILLIDDASDRKYLGKPLRQYVAKLPVTTKLLKLHTREGLVAARLAGARVATGKTLTFLDAHCECSPGWLEPLLARVKEDRKKVVSPVIDIISDDNFSYIKSFEMHWGAFNWQLHFRWFALEKSELQKRQTDIAEPFRTPAMAGGLFTIERDYFFEIGSYDEEMKIWGGDNLEMSFRIWQCGGELEIVPCSHVGHLFRKSSPYTFPGGITKVLNRNMARMAVVWMDEWAQFYMKFNPEVATLAAQEDVTARLELRRSLQCKSFGWYLETVWPQHFLPADNRFFGELVLTGSRQALDKFTRFAWRHGIDDWPALIHKSREHINSIHEILSSASGPNDKHCLVRSSSTNSSVQQPIGGTAYVTACEERSDNLLSRMFIITSAGKILTDENLCLDASERGAGGNGSDGARTAIRLTTCAETPRQLWTFDFAKLQLIHMVTGLCAVTDKDDRNRLYIDKCDGGAAGRGNDRAGWMLIPFPWKM